MRGWHHSPSVQQDLDYFVVVGVGRQDEGGDVRGEGGRVTVHRLPALNRHKYQSHLDLLVAHTEVEMHFK